MKNTDRAPDLKRRYLLLREENPRIRARNAAEKLGVSEGELLASRVGDGATRLVDSAEEILKSILPLGEVMALTRNEFCVHERKGAYDNHEFFRHGNMYMGQFVNPDVDLRLFMSCWKYVFAVSEDKRKSVQFFDETGLAIHKIYLTPKSDEAAYDEMVKSHLHERQDDFIQTRPSKPKPADKPDSEIDWTGFREAWKNLKDTHDFFPLLKKFGVGREQALRGIGDDFACQVGNDAARGVLELARDRECEIMVFVGNRGCIQIHTGKVKNLLERDCWFNVLDPKFNLHLCEEGVAGSWITKKPTKDGTVTALEIFDTDGELIATFFGRRKPGIPEQELWSGIAAEIQERSSKSNA